MASMQSESRGLHGYAAAASGVALVLALGRPVYLSFKVVQILRIFYNPRSAQVVHRFKLYADFLDGFRVGTSSMRAMVRFAWVDWTTPLNNSLQYSTSLVLYTTILYLTATTSNWRPLRSVYTSRSTACFAITHAGDSDA
ncbi:hypothetical protein K474DRAFT_211133 [Panus rudis PR-1116 ss-1]|nr:hypothetical protein K474DRAFT_211133 [Panus rudis PR-1116 ss-1]